jgi:hypothetical protein
MAVEKEFPARTGILAFMKKRLERSLGVHRYSGRASDSLRGVRSNPSTSRCGCTGGATWICMVRESLPASMAKERFKKGGGSLTGFPRLGLTVVELRFSKMA